MSSPPPHSVLCGDVASEAVVCGSVVCGDVVSRAAVCGATMCGAVVCGVVVYGGVVSRGLVCAIVVCGAMACGAMLCGAMVCGHVVSRVWCVGLCGVGLRCTGPCSVGWRLVLWCVASNIIQTATVCDKGDAMDNIAMNKVEPKASSYSFVQLIQCGVWGCCMRGWGCCGGALRHCDGL